MSEKYKVEIEKERQKTLEERIELIIGVVQKVKEETVSEKSTSDELIRADKVSDAIIKATSPPGVYVITEEGNYGSKSAIIEVWDPIDGSSEFNRIGKKRSPLTTAGLVICENKIISAAVGDIWDNKIYGLDEKGLYFRELGQEKNYISIDKEISVDEKKKKEKKKFSLSLDEAFVAAYAPTFDRIKIIFPLFEVVPYLHNNGGQPFALRVVEGQSVKTYAAALEAKPKELWEHIGPLMAEYGGASVSRLDGNPLELNIGIKQTSITAVNDNIRRGIIDALRTNYGELGIEHTSKV